MFDFRENQWISFEDLTSMDIKAKYARVRGLAGLALKDLSMDGGSKCGGSLLEAAYSGLSKQTRAPRGAVLRSLEREILETPVRPLDSVNVSPFRISRVVDVEGHVHVIRKVRSISLRFIYFFIAFFTYMIIITLLNMSHNFFILYLHFKYLLVT